MSKINNKSRKLKAGITLTSVFSILLLLLVFNFFEIFTKLILGSFGLFFYPLCLFFIVFGILLMLNKDIKVSKSIITFLILWIITFVLILQLATSANIDTNFSTYISTIFKDKITAGGVLFGVILYPLYYLTYDVASYIFLVIALVIFTSILIDKIYVYVKATKNMALLNQDIGQVEDEQAEENEDENENLEDDEEVEETTQTTFENNDEDIFIADDEDSGLRDEAKEILGLSKEKRTIAEKEIDYTEKLEKQIEENSITERVNKTDKKPTIFVHEEEISSLGNVEPKRAETKPKSETTSKDEERKKSALEYLNITKGKFETKNKRQPGFDNVSTNSQMNKQLEENNSRLENNPINIRNLNTSIDKEKVEENLDIYDNNFTKSEFERNQEKYAKNNSSINNIINKLPELAQKKYSGEVNENIVETKSSSPITIPLIEPTKKTPVKQTLYKKPPTYVRPPIDLLKKYSTDIESDDEYMAEKGKLIVETLKAFRIDTKIINAIKGPTFTRYELQMAPGISVNSVNSKINDLSMALESNCRVQVPIPGKNAFGIEVPNKKRITVGLREILESQNFQNNKSPLTFALGKDISGECKVATIDKLVHTLVAGSTGSGKSVCLNTMLISLFYKASPEDLRLILVDPKTVEFSAFNNLPHMLIPNTITECDKAVSALGWLVDEMDNRYKKLASLGVKKISEYNETPEVISGQVPKMYYIVMIFDEVGDFMNRAKKEIEEKIILLAAKSRACGIHLVLATQRPTVDVITGTIKANLPSRISFAVNSYNDSKTILESSGAEYLLGMGDMLFLPQGSNDMDRIQGCFVDNKELKSILEFIKENNECDFDETIEDQMFNKKDGFDSNNGAEDAFDPLLKDCLKYFIKAKKASASSLQAYFGIGYPKANKIVLQMEKAGFVSPGDSNNRRVLYITQQEFEERFGEDLDE